MEWFTLDKQIIFKDDPGIAFSSNLKFSSYVVSIVIAFFF